jgi:2,3-bisphosphoglycerate-independent phosphoglycerate mutase
MLMILDGWGINPDSKGNAVAIADTPVLDGLFRKYPSTRITCMGEAVGLPPGVMGNSEVGHLNIGAGRVVYQDLMRINKAISDGSFFENDAFLELMRTIKREGSALHLMGLASASGVHSDLPHLVALLEMAAREGVGAVYIHAITDGRDSPPDSGIGYVRQIQAAIDRIGLGKIATICGRYYAMDRDKRWDRTEKAYRLYTHGEGVPETDPVAAVEAAYGRGETDEFIKPVTLMDGGKGNMADGDGIIFFNFRADRARQITRALTDASFGDFERAVVPRLGGFVCMSLYDETFSLPMAFPPVSMQNILGEVVSGSGRKQLRIAETEKYAHVTYFFNGGEETPFPGEDRCLVPSPREVATYDLKPEMSAREVTRELLERLGSGKYDLVVVNFANMDMVGHTGIIEAAVKACEAVDGCVGEILRKLHSLNGVALITADHGNSEKMVAENGTPYTAHTLNQVPLILVDDTRTGVALREGILGDIAPTILEIMGLEQPGEMTGRSLLESRAQKTKIRRAEDQKSRS